MSAYIGFARQKDYCDVQFCLDDPSVEVMSNKLAEWNCQEKSSRKTHKIDAR